MRANWSSKMDKNVSIILSTSNSNYRRIAQINWGLTDEQMNGMDVHHFPPISKGGRNIPEHLYVCSPYVHTHWWHNGEQFVMWARRGAQKAHEKKTSDGKSVTALKGGISNTKEKLLDGRSKNAVYASECAKISIENDPIKKEKRRITSSTIFKKLHQDKDENGKSKLSLKSTQKLHQEKTDDNKSKHAVKMAKSSHQKTDEQGRSIKVMIMNEKVHNQKDEYGRSLHTINYLLKYNEQRKKEIKITHIESGEVFIFNSLAEAAKTLKVHKTGLSQVALKKSKQHKGYYAEYLI